MKQFRALTAIMLSLIMTLTLLPMTAYAEGGDTDPDVVSPEFQAGQLIAVAQKGTSKSEMREIASEADGELETMSTLADGARAALIEVDEGSEMSAINTISAESKILFVQPNYTYYIEGLFTESEVPNDPIYTNGYQEYLQADPAAAGKAGSINAAGAWEQIRDIPIDEADKPLVAVIDTGAKLGHEDLQGCLVKEKCVTYQNGEQLDFYAGDGSDDDNGHGTNVTGVIGADINNGKGIAGVAGGRVKTFVVDVSNRRGGVTTLDGAMGVYYATDQGAKVINLSFGGHSRDLLFERAVKYAWDKGTLCVCSGGNDRTAHLHSPGDSPYAVQVMAHKLSGEATSFTCYGDERDISAPGDSIYTTNNIRNTSYSNVSGTSFASPITAGAVALMLSADPSLTPRQLKNLLYTSSGKESFSPEKEGQGFGRLNLDTAVRNVLANEKTDPEKIVLNKTDINMYEGADTSIEYAVYPGNTNTVEAVFSSSNEGIVTVDEYGVIHAKAPGKASVRVTCKGATAICEVNVREKPYVRIDKKPYYTKRTFTLDEMIDISEEYDESGVVVEESGGFYHLYRIDLKAGETITAVMHSPDCDSSLSLKDMYDRAVDVDKEDLGDFSKLSYTAEMAGTYQLLAYQVNVKNHNTTEYSLKVASDRSYCDPKVISTDYGQMRMSWPAVKNADCYRVRKYKDKGMTQVESEEYVDALKYTDTSYDKNRVQYYSVTSYLQTVSGAIFNGETSVVVKMGNPLTVSGKTLKVKAKKLKKKKTTFARSKALSVSKAKGNVTYTKLSGNKKIIINKKTGKVTLKKGLKKGTYKVKVKVTASGDSSYKALANTVTFKVKVR